METLFAISAEKGDFDLALRDKGVLLFTRYPSKKNPQIIIFW